MSVFLALAMQAATQPPLSGRSMSQARLNAMADACHAPRDWVELRGHEVVFKANPDAGLTKTECMLKKISAVVDASNIAFIGNDQVSEDK